MVLLGVGCVLFGIFPIFGVNLAGRAAYSLGELMHIPVAWPGRPFEAPLRGISTIGGATAALCLGLALLRRRLLRGRTVEAASTWGCGYSRPSPRMQYSATSFSMPLVGLFAAMVPRVVDAKPPEGLFPGGAKLDDHCRDLAEARLLQPVLERGGVAIRFLRRLQQGRLHTYLVYMLVTLLALLIWQLAGQQGAR
jgi:hydrogenase-4 component B